MNFFNIYGNSFIIKRPKYTSWESFNNSYFTEKDGYSFTRLSHISNTINAKNTSINNIRKQFFFTIYC